MASPQLEPADPDSASIVAQLLLTDEQAQLLTNILVARKNALIARVTDDSDQTVAEIRAINSILRQRWRLDRLAETSWLREATSKTLVA